MILPVDYALSVKNKKEYKLFDFSSTPGSKWAMFYDADGALRRGDSIEYIGKKYIKNYTVYTYTINNISFDPEIKKIVQFGKSFDVEISKKNGIMSITRWGVPHRIEFKATLYPKEQFINNLGDGWEL